MKYRLSEGILEGVLDSGSKYDKIKEVGYERAERLDRVITGLQDSIKVVQAIVDSEDPDEPSDAKDSLTQLKDDLKTMQDAKDRLEDELADAAEQEKRERERVGGDNSIYSDADDMRAADEDEDGLDADEKSKGSGASEKSSSSDKTKEGEDGDDADSDDKDGKGKQGRKGDKDGKDSDSGEAGTEEGEGEDEEGEGKEGDGEGKEDDSENGKGVKSGASKHSGNGPSEADSSDGDETDGADGNQSNASKSNGKKSGQKPDGSDGDDSTDGEDGGDGESENDAGDQSGKKGSKNKQAGKGSNGDDSEGDGDEDGEDDGESDGDDTDGEQSGKKSGKNGKQSKSGKPGEDSAGEESDGDQDGDDVGDNDKTGEKSSQKGQKGQKSKGSSDGDSNDSDGDNADEDDEDDENDGDDSTGNGGSGSKGKKSKSKNSDDDDDDDDSKNSQGGDNDRDDDDEEEEDEEEEVDLLAPPQKSRSNGNSRQQQKAVRNPFGTPYDNDNDQDGGGNGGGTPPDIRDPKLSELIKALSQLTGDAKQGAFDGLSKILADREAKVKGQKVGESLSEALGDTDSILEMTPEAFSRMINTALGHAIKAKGVIKTTPLAKRIEMSKDLDLNPKKVWQELEKEMKVNQVVDPIYSDPDEIERIKKRRKANSRNFGSFARFQETLRQVIFDQIRPKTVHRSTWQMPDRRLIPGSGVVKKGTALRRERLDDIPILQVYVDQSASWDAEDRKLASSILAEFAELQERRELDLQTYYFADHVHTDPWAARAENSTGAWSDILDNIANTKANNVVIMTDSDLANQSNDSNNHRVKIEGGVWFLYKGNPESYSYNSGKDTWLTDHLQGRMFNGEFKIGDAGQKQKTK